MNSATIVQKLWNYCNVLWIAKEQRSAHPDCVVVHEHLLLFMRRVFLREGGDLGDGISRRAAECDG